MLQNNSPGCEDYIVALRKAILRSEKLLGEKKIPLPSSHNPESIISDYSIGYSCNLANNAYGFCKIARKNGCNAKLFLQPNFIDTVVLSLPIWDEVYFVSEAMPDQSTVLPSWENPDFVKSSYWDQAYVNNMPINFEYEKLKDFFKDTPVAIYDQISYLMSYTVIPHRDLLRHYNSVDILHVSGLHIGVASFTTKPYVTFPFGGDLFITPFADNEAGWMQNRGFKNADRHIVSGKIMLEYMEALGISQGKIDLLPLMIDTDVNAPDPDNSLRKDLNEKYPDKVIFLAGARQNWAWKGNDKLFRAIARIAGKDERAVFLTVWYGQDTAKSQKLIKELGIENRIVKIGVVSKAALRKYINAADVCIDQFTHGGLGTFALESMSCGKPLVTYYDRARHFDFAEDPPLNNCFTEDEIYEKITFCLANANKLADMGNKHRDWTKKYHGHETLWPEYDTVYKKALSDSKNRG
ncbi:MAG: glycosyltransferase family 4 protein [Candidatus Omnitrophica bacterium]|nr:glycosyltransferase family 4 protein [Candidatus Omnitrophota bacterium]